MSHIALITPQQAGRPNNTHSDFLFFIFILFYFFVLAQMVYAAVSATDVVEKF
jgi:hypothetical protein